MSTLPSSIISLSCETCLSCMSPCFISIDGFCLSIDKRNGDHWCSQHVADDVVILFIVQRHGVRKKSPALHRERRRSTRLTGIASTPICSFLELCRESDNSEVSFGYSSGFGLIGNGVLNELENTRDRRRRRWSLSDGNHHHLLWLWRCTAFKASPDGILKRQSIARLGVFCRIAA